MAIGTWQWLLCDLTFMFSFLRECKQGEECGILRKFQVGLSLEDV